MVPTCHETGASGTSSEEIVEPTFDTATDCSRSRRVSLHEHGESGVLKGWVLKMRSRAPGIGGACGPSGGDPAPVKLTRPRSENTTLRSCLVDGYESRDTAVEVHERRSNDPCSGATGEVQKPFCTRAVKSQAIDSPPNSF